MAEAKTKPTGASVAGFFARIADPQRRADCKAIARIMRRVTRKAPKMWGSSIVGFGQYRYAYSTGHMGESCQTGFAARASAISVYLVAAGPGQQELLARLGRHKMGKSCLTFRRLSDVDIKLLEQLIAGSVAEVERRYGAGASGA